MDENERLEYIAAQLEKRGSEKVEIADGNTPVEQSGPIQLGSQLQRPVSGL